MVARYNLKLSPRFYGPFQVVQHLGKVAYHLNLAATAQIHHVFHVSCLKKKLGAQIRPIPSLPLVNIDGEIQPKPEAVLDRRMRKLGHRAITEVLIKWVGAPLEDRCWELLGKMQELYPHLVGKIL
ncbi:uncharacterized protein LOC122278676 [Carya illinoinensis]|uniref:uncharacterized protein LOC122278676 n=1 Tax=Carya illinoinensis TaxID=32201 RepID=UPI001C71CE4D|nr:uncharacterized protein LOC122278676 [Carya illinoinensis]